MSADLQLSTSTLPKILAGGQVSAASTDTTVYTVPASSNVKVTTFSLCNVTASTVVVNVSVSPSGGTISDGTHKVLASYSLAAYDTTKLTEVEGAMLDAGAFISINAGTAAAVNYLITGALSS